MARRAPVSGLSSGMQLGPKADESDTHSMGDERHFEWVHQVVDNIGGNFIDL